MIALIASNTADAVGESAALGEGIIGEAVKTGEARSFKASEVQHLRSAGADSPEITGKSILAVPIKTPIHTLGCMLLTGKQSGDYTEDDLKICENCCAILALDIDDKGFRFRPFEDKEPVVTVREVVKEYLNGEEMQQVLKGIDLDIFPGELMVVVGESGCGKSTLLNIIGGMDKMTSGKLMVEGKDMSNHSEDELTKYRRENTSVLSSSHTISCLICQLMRT